MSSLSQPERGPSGPPSNSACHSFQVPSAVPYCSRPTSVKATPWYRPAAPSCSGLWSSNSSALVPMRFRASPSRTSVLRQKPHTALAEAADAKSTGAPQFGHAAR